MNCTRCNKRLSRKTARSIDGKVLCSSCMFAPAKPVGELTKEASAA